MKNYFNVILIASILLLIFPFLAFPELWENIYVSVLAFIVGYTSMLLRHKYIKTDDDEETSLQDYVKELKERFKDHKNESKAKRISEITLDEK
ncbi:MAG: hypothetical protein LR005_00795 [Candidatus Pacebacteria bacterium]|nr:hypothetical protein [Candidatus Paceibacterota bacterium]